METQNKIHTKFNIFYSDYGKQHDVKFYHCHRKYNSELSGNDDIPSTKFF